jgi:hypothetical protein
MNKILGLITLVTFFFSCTNDLDFNQVKDVKFEPVFVANLAYFDLPVAGFVTKGQNLTFDAQDFDVFRNSFFRENLKRVDFFFEINNTINRAYTIDLVMLDANNQQVCKINFDVPAYKGNPNVVTHTEIFENANLNSLKKAKRMGFVINMLDGLPLNGGSLKLRSGSTVYLELE